MAFYKLFCIIHRRTDWYKLWRWQREIMMPEWYEERERRTSQAMKRLFMPFTVIGNMMANNYYLNSGDM